MLLEVLDDLKSKYNVDYTYVNKEVLENCSLIKRESFNSVDEI